MNEHIFPSEHVYFPACHSLVLPEEYRSCVFFPWFRRPWRPVRSRVSVLPAWTLRCCDGLKVKIFRGVDGETTSSMGILGHLRIWLENWKMASVKGYTDVYIVYICTYIYIYDKWMFIECSLLLRTSWQYTAWMTDSVMIYGTTFWFTILSIILADCFYTMCNTGGTYECTVFIYLRLCCWGYLLGLL